MVILDTSLVVDYLRQRGKKTILLRVAEKVSKKNLAVSLVTVQELYEGKSVARLEEEEAIWALLGLIEVQPYTYEVAKLAGEISRDRSMDFADAAIAATTIVNGAQLATLNPKDFAEIKGLEIYRL